MTDDLVYVGKDLEAMSFAVNYHGWILKIFEPYLGVRIVEVGAGTGSFSELLLELPLESLSLVEPSEAMIIQLRNRMDKLNPSFSVRIHQAIFKQVAGQIRLTDQPDSILYVNVLEHIVDDHAELHAINDALGKEGRVFI